MIGHWLFQNDMNYQKSCGAVVVDTTGEQPWYLCVLQSAGHWSLPKGRVDEDENEKVTAAREIKKETGLDVEFMGEFRAEARYSPKSGVMKTVVFFLAKPMGGTLAPNMDDIRACEWLTLDEAKGRLVYDDMKDILDEAEAYLRG